MAKSGRDVVIVDGVRTPFAKANSKLRALHPAELGKVALKELVNRTNLDVNLVDEVIVGNVGNPSDAVNISRVVALRAGIPQSVSAHSVHRNCASAMESITSGYDKIKAGSADVVVAGGTENMSQFPLMMGNAFVQTFEKLSMARSPIQQLTALAGLLKADLKQVVDLMTTGPFQSTPFKPRVAVVEGLTDPFVGINMGQTAEILAKEFGLSREEQDEFALRSHQKAVQAQQSKRLDAETTPVFLPPKYKEFVTQDIGPRAEQTLAQLAKLKPFFDRQYGTITVGNACPITDGAAMVLLMSREKALSLGYKPIASIRSYAFAGLEPERMGLGPVYSTPKALKKAGLTLADMGLFEINEAFAAQVLSCVKAMGSKKFAQEKLGLDQAVGEIDMEKLNVNGGAIALGHPVGATGTRLVITLMKEMQIKNVQFGLATLCIGGGQGGAVILEREQS
ncbi:MAG: thiolase family protein [Bdellovibrionales bacterium]|nr:thiolase family protein [Bdellovibrionales bacterium]